MLAPCVSHLLDPLPFAVVTSTPSYSPRRQPNVTRSEHDFGLGCFGCDQGLHCEVKPTLSLMSSLPQLVHLTDFAMKKSGAERQATWC